MGIEQRRLRWWVEPPYALDPGPFLRATENINGTRPCLRTRHYALRGVMRCGDCERRHRPYCWRCIYATRDRLCLREFTRYPLAIEIYLDKQLPDVATQHPVVLDGIDLKRDAVACQSQSPASSSRNAP